MSQMVILTRRRMLPIAALPLGSSLIAGIYFGILTGAQGWEYARDQFVLNRWYVVPIWVLFGVEAALYSISRFRLWVPAAAATTHDSGGAIVGTSGLTSTTAMVACCLHHATDLLPILGVSAAATFLSRYQRPFMLVGLGMEVAGALIMLAVIYRDRRKGGALPTFQPSLETR